MPWVFMISRTPVRYVKGSYCLQNIGTIWGNGCLFPNLERLADMDGNLGQCLRKFGNFMQRGLNFGGVSFGGGGGGLNWRPNFFLLFFITENLSV